MAGQLVPHGFAARGNDLIFDRERGDVRQSISLACLVRISHLAFAASAGVRFHRFEELVDKFDPPNSLATDEDRRSRSTLGKDLGSHSRGLWQKSWSIRDKEQVPNVADKIVTYLVKEAWPFFEIYSDMEQAFAVLSKDDSDAKDLMTLDDVRAKNAIGLAFLLHGPERAQEVAAKKLSWLRTRPHADAAGVEAWVQRLLRGVEPSEAEGGHTSIRRSD